MTNDLTIEDPIEPHPSLDIQSCDTIAECSDSLPTHLGRALWRVLGDHGTPLRELIDIEESCPNDALGLNTPAELWEHFTRDEQLALNDWAEQDTF